MTRKQWIIIGALGSVVAVFFVCMGCLVLSMLISPQRQTNQTVADSEVTEIPQPTVQNPKVTILPAATSTSLNPSLTYESIINTAKQLTELKRNDYYQSLIGKSIHWTGTVADVNSSGEVHVRIANTISYDVAVQGVPQNAYTKLNLNDSVQFDGTITKVDDMFGSGHPIITVKSTALTSQANITNPTATKVSQSLTFADITNTAKQLTEIKRNDYYKSLVGKTIHDTGKVADVTDKGDVHIRIATTISYDVVVQGLPKTTYTNLNLNDPIEFNGTITNVDDMFGSGHPIVTVKSTP